MIKIWSSIAFRLAAGYGILFACSIVVVSAIFYFGTVGVLARRTDAELFGLSKGFADVLRTDGAGAVRWEVQDRLHDASGDEDTEVYLLTAPDGRKIVGNLTGWRPRPAQFGRLVEERVVRDGRPSISRLLARRLANGDIIVVGRDMKDRREIERLVWRALIGGCIFALALAVLGALLFRRRLERRIAAIRRTALDIEAGDLSRRVPVSVAADEFARLGRDINRMLDRIEHLMDGVRHVSNAIAHDLRTPLGRIRAQLDESLQPGKGREPLVATARAAIGQIDEVIRIFDRLLQIAEAESGARRQSFAPVFLDAVIADVVELYDAAAEALGISLLTECDPTAAALGDKDLLASALANLIDNALKYAGGGTRVRVCARRERDTVVLAVGDDGPGIPIGERSRVVERFYRLDRSRSMAGNGLGLSIVNAVAALHGGTLLLEDARPGLLARIVFPRGDEAAPLRPSRQRPIRLGTAG